MHADLLDAAMLMYKRHVHTIMVWKQYRWTKPKLNSFTTVVTGAFQRRAFSYPTYHLRIGIPNSR